MVLGLMIDDFLKMCTDEWIIVFLLTPHSSDECQPLDVGILSVQKEKIPRMNLDPNLGVQTMQLIKMIDPFAEASAITNVMKAFK